jgi:hypothetical protein
MRDRDVLEAVEMMVAADPKNAEAVMGAVIRGWAEAYEDAKAKAAVASNGLLAALALTTKRGIGGDLRKSLESQVVAAIPVEVASQVERDFLTAVLDVG